MNDDFEQSLPITQEDIRRNVKTIRHIVMLVGLIPICISLTFLGKAYEIEHNWKQLPATVDNSSVTYRRGRGASYVRTVAYHYYVGSHLYSGEDSINQGQNDNDSTDKTVTAFYNPNLPSISRLFPENEALLGWLLIIGSAVGIVGGVTVSEASLKRRFTNVIYSDSPGYSPSQVAREIICSRHPLPGAGNCRRRTVQTEERGDRVSQIRRLS